ncbi:sugar ABC transporter substrate-binding protein [Candidatus Bipolaricaulota bacterium]|nr:sugar ABC transporter substrate-binding protein [Candidatus Bipolaricaulota bacterium]
MNKKIAVVLLLGILGTALFSVFSFSADVQLDYWIWDPTIRGKYEKAIEEFESQNPDIEVNLNAIEPDNYWTKMRLNARTNQLPDVFNMSSAFLEQWVSNGSVMALDKFLEEDLNQENYFSPLFDVLTFDGSTYALPFAWVTPVLYYNKDAFDEAGVDYPSNGWTWDDFLKAARKLTKDSNGDGKIDQWGFWFYGRYAHIEPWIYQNNGRLLDENKQNFDPSPEAVEALRFLTDLVLEHEVAPSKSEMSGIDQQNVFPQGEAAMWVDGSWSIENNRRIIGDSFDWGIAKVPRGPSWEEDTLFAWPDNIAISPNTDHPEAAWKLAKFFSGPGLSSDLYMAGKIPSYNPLAKSEEFFNQDAQPSNITKLLEWGSLPMKTSFTKSWSEWRGYAGAEGLGLTGAIDQVINGRKDFDQAMKEANKYINKVLDENYEE